MPETLPQSRRIRILRDEVSRKIAAGEVIDRPFSIVRELLDNAIDAGAGAIDVHLEAGGLSRVRVVDDGAGMGLDDLGLCWQPHATSKIESEEDLLRVASLGFRGEALSSIAVCSNMVMVSCLGGEAPAHRLEVRGGRLESLAACQGRKGTVVDVSELFFNYPARKKFLRSVSAESGLCRTIFVDRAASYPSLSFRFFTDNDLKLSLPAASLVERIGQAYAKMVDSRLLAETTEMGEGFTVRVVAGSPDLRRRDRKLLQCFVNGRRVSEFSLAQAAEFGFSGYLPGGWFPAAFVFVHIDPSLVDFNIHPAKKEVRIRKLPEVHRAVVSAVRKMLQPRSAPLAPPAAQAAPGEVRHVASSPGSLASIPFRPEPPRRPEPEGKSIRFLGQVFGVFLVFELPGRILIMDQHAAHERIIFERLCARAPALQEMLFPLCFDVSEQEEGRLSLVRDELEAMGIALRHAGARAWEVTALAEDFRALPEDRLVELVRGVGGEEWQHAFRATAACRMAIKEGEQVDPVMARDLCAQALRLKVPRCPHGRPIWHELTEERLLKLVDRPQKP